MDFVKPLSNLIGECGIKDGSYPDSEAGIGRQYFNPTIGGLTDETITENIFVDMIVSCFREKKKDMWFETRVNLWELANARDPNDALKRFRHLLQPDIDLLYGSCIDGHRQTPMVGVEVKLFKGHGYGRKLSKTTAWEGYYAGLDEAISLLTMGLDCVYLWHVHVFPSRVLVKYLEEYGEDFFKKIAIECRDLSIAGGSWISTTLEFLEIPIGYVYSFLIVDPYNKSFEIVMPRIALGAEINPLSTSEALPTRNLIMESLNLESLKTEIKRMFCANCKEDFGYHKLYYKFCPYCGAKLEPCTSY